MRFVHAFARFASFGGIVGLSIVEYSTRARRPIGRLAALGTGSADIPDQQITAITARTGAGAPRTTASSPDQPTDVEQEQYEQPEAGPHRIKDVVQPDTNHAGVQNEEQD